MTSFPMSGEYPTATPDMHGWVLRQTGEPLDVLALEGELPEPEPGPGEILVDVDAAGVSFPEVMLIRGTYQEALTLPSIPGTELAGTVIRSGPGTSFTPGQRLVGLARAPHGALAQRSLLHVDSAAAIPADVSPSTAVALPVNGVTAHLALHHRAHVRPGEWVLVHGAAGGIGTAALQLARAAGARVIAVAAGSDRLDLVGRLGADVVIDEQEDIVSAVKHATAGRGADVVIDPVGGDAFDASRRCIAFEGRIVVVGFTSGRIPDLSVNHLILKTFSVLGVNNGAYQKREPNVPRRALIALLELCATGSYHPHIHREYEFSDAAAALADVAAGRVPGKAVVCMHPQPGDHSERKSRR
jgi:NADPH2:quinone reductase